MKTQEFWKSLLWRIETVDLSTEKAFAPAGKIDKENGEEVVGTIEEEFLRKAYVVLSKSDAEITPQVDAAKEATVEMLLRAIINGQRPKNPAMPAELALACNRHDAISRLFWNGVKEAFPAIANRREISLRENWQVVVCPPKSRYEAQHFVFGEMEFQG